MKIKYILLTGIGILTTLGISLHFLPIAKEKTTKIISENTGETPINNDKNEEPQEPIIFDYPFISDALLKQGLIMHNGGFLQSDLDQVKNLWLQIPKHSIKTLDMIDLKKLTNLKKLGLHNLNDGTSVIRNRYIEMINLDQLSSLIEFSASDLPFSELDGQKLPPNLKKISIYGVGMKTIKNEEFFDRLSYIHLSIDIAGACKKYDYPEVKWNDIRCED